MIPFHSTELFISLPHGAGNNHLVSTLSPLEELYNCVLQDIHMFKVLVRKSKHKHLSRFLYKREITSIGLGGWELFCWFWVFFKSRNLFFVPVNQLTELLPFCIFQISACEKFSFLVFVSWACSCYWKCLLNVGCLKTDFWLCFKKLYDVFPPFMIHET